MRLASYNVENLFDRAAVMDQTGWSKGKPVLEKFAALNELLGEITYTDAMKKKMVSLMKDLGLERSDTGPFVILRRNHGALLKRPRAGGLEITAGGRADWVGSLELIEEPVDEIAMRVTAKVMIDLQTDILAVIEAESRPSLAAFNQEIVRAMGGEPFRHVMVIDGNDTRGIDVGAKHEIYHVIYELAKQGIAVLFASSDLPEVLGVADRIVVMREGEIAGELLHEQANEQQALSLAMPKVSQAVA